MKNVVQGRLIEHKRTDELIDYECSYCGHVYAQEYNEDTKCGGTASLFRALWMCFGE